MSFQVVYNGDALTPQLSLRTLLYAVPCTGLLLDIRANLSDATSTPFYFVGRRALDGIVNGLAEPLVNTNEPQAWGTSSFGKIMHFSFPVGVSRVDFTASSVAGEKLYIAVLDEFG
jgi:hypothetical protein